MAEATGPRRSDRTRKPVKSYADEQNERSTSAPPPKRKKKAPVIDLEAAASSEVYEDAESSDVEIAKITTKASNKLLATDTDIIATGSKRSKKAKTTELALDPNMKRPKGEKRPPKLYDAPKVDWGGLLPKVVANAPIVQKRLKAKIPRLYSGQNETRARPYVTDPPESYHKFLDRANTDRMVVLERERGVEEDCHANHLDCPCETVQIAGSKANVYKVQISHIMSCNCPEALFRKSTCKHMLYVLHNVLKAPGHLRYQNAFLTSELREIFDKAPPMPVETAEDTVKDGNRKEITEDCPICFTEMDEEEGIVWCKAACGNNIHKSCFEGWANAKAYNVTCPFCRSAWQYGDPPKRQISTQTKVQMPAFRGVDGYYNVRDQLGYD